MSFASDSNGIFVNFSSNEHGIDVYCSPFEYYDDNDKFSSYEYKNILF